MGEAKRKKEQFRAFGSCVYCGNRCIPTMDHVPPKGIFPKPRPQNLVTVPACKECNEMAGQLDDEKFKAALAIQVNPKASNEHNKFTQSGLDTLRNNRRIVRDLFSDSKRIWRKNSDGVPLPATQFLWSAKNHDDVIERITRGLYFENTKKPITQDSITVEVSFFGRDDKDISDIVQSLNLRTIGSGQFNYAFCIGEDPRFSVWLYQFYGTHHCGAHTYPRRNNDLP